MTPLIGVTLTHAPNGDGGLSPLHTPLRAIVTALPYGAVLTLQGGGNPHEGVELQVRPDGVYGVWRQSGHLNDTHQMITTRIHRTSASRLRPSGNAQAVTVNTAGMPLDGPLEVRVRLKAPHHAELFLARRGAPPEQRLEGVGLRLSREGVFAELESGEGAHAVQEPDPMQRSPYRRQLSVFVHR